MAERERLGDRADFQAWAAEVVDALKQRRSTETPPRGRSFRRLAARLAPARAVVVRR